MDCTVEGVTWGVSGLIAFLRPALRICHKIESVCYQNENTPPPKHIIHPGIIIHGYLYEYGGRGIKKSRATCKGNPEAIYKVAYFKKREVMGVSPVKLQEFENWIRDQKIGKFNQRKFCPSTNNCTHFAIAAANFLNVDCPEDWIRFQEYAEENPKFSKRIAKCQKTYCSTPHSDAESKPK